MAAGPAHLHGQAPGLSLGARGQNSAASHHPLPEEGRLSIPCRKPPAVEESPALQGLLHKILLDNRPHQRRGRLFCPSLGPVAGDRVHFRAGAAPPGRRDRPSKAPQGAGGPCGKTPRGPGPVFGVQIGRGAGLSGEPLGVYQQREGAAGAAAVSFGPGAEQGQHLGRPPAALPFFERRPGRPERADFDFGRVRGGRPGSHPEAAGGAEL